MDSFKKEMIEDLLRSYGRDPSKLRKPTAKELWEYRKNCRDNAIYLLEQGFICQEEADRVIKRAEEYDGPY